MQQDIGGWQVRLDPALTARLRAEGVWRNATLADDARRAAETRPDVVCAIEGGASVTFAEALRQAEAVASHLWALGLRPGDVVAFQLPNWLEAVTIDVAASLLGLVIVPIVPIYRDAELASILADCRAKAFFVPESFRGIDFIGMATRLRAGLPDLAHIITVRGAAAADGFSFGDLLTPAGGGVPWPKQRADAIKLLLYTSGTTGRAKGALHSHETLARALGSCVRHWGIQPGESVLMPSPVTHITGFAYGIEMPFQHETRTVFMERWDAATAVRLIDRENIAATVSATPFLMETVSAAEAAGTKLASLRIFGCGGAAVPPALIRRANATFANGRAFRLYGSTETTVVTLGFVDSGEGDLAADTDGQIVDFEVKFVDAQGKPVAEGEEGEILARGPSLFLGYTRTEDNEQAFDADGYFHTGDAGRAVGRDGLVITGRIKDLIIRGGENLSAKEIEDALHRHASVKEAAVVSMPHARLGETVCAYVIPAKDARPSLEELCAFLDAAGLARQKFPEHLELVDDLPRTPSGKVRKNLLRERIARQKPAG